MTLHGSRVLLVGTSDHVCALPLGRVVETMRAQPLSPIIDSPPFVSGLSVIRGLPTPVVDLRALLNGGEADSRPLLVTLRIERRCVALAVDHVHGVRELDPERALELPPLTRSAHPKAIEAVAVVDRQLLLILEATHIIPEQAWADLIGAGSSR